MAIDRNVLINGEGYAIVVETDHLTKTHGKLRACTAVHQQRFARRIGGVRFVPGAPPEDRTELGELAEAMTWKSALAALPADGQKSVVYCPEGIPDHTEMAEVLASHLAELKVADSGVIFGPDINCDERVMDLVAHRHGEGDHVSGLREGQGGLSIDRYGYTASGLEAALLVVAQSLDWDLAKMSATVQGFGAVGAHVALNLKRRGVSIRSVNTYHGALIATSSAGLDVERLFEAWLRDGDSAFEQYRENAPAGARWAHRDSVFAERADIFIPAARTDVLAMPGEIESAKGAADVVRFADATGLKVVLEGANHPLTSAAEQHLESRGVFILPDYLVNCGGLIGCWADWVYRAELEGEAAGDWFERLKNGARTYTAHVVERNVSRMLSATRNEPQGLRAAAHRLAQDLRRELHSSFLEHGSTNAGDSDGRAFARASMDSLLR